MKDSNPPVLEAMFGVLTDSNLWLGLEESLGRVHRSWSWSSFFGIEAHSRIHDIQFCYAGISIPALVLSVSHCYCCFFCEFVLLSLALSIVCLYPSPWFSFLGFTWYLFHNQDHFLLCGLIWQAIDHIINSAAKTNYMSGGKINVPIVFRGPNGAAAGVAAQHSQVFLSPQYVNLVALSM
jgi:hypothetical protein